MTIIFAIVFDPEPFCRELRVERLKTEGLTRLGLARRGQHLVPRASTETCRRALRLELRSKAHVESLSRSLNKYVI
jgi:hypothetical protein